MKILVVGNPDSCAEFNAKFGSMHSTQFKSCQEMLKEDLVGVDMVFDFEITANSSHCRFYHQHPGLILFLNSVKTTLLELIKSLEWQHTAIGFNGLPGMFNRPLLELTAKPKHHDMVDQICKGLATDYKLVDDRVGMVTARVVCMIINEAYYTTHEGTAEKQDIDQAMKLGTNYPAGPFEMAKTIGLTHVYELLESLRKDTGEERYKICPLLKKCYLESL